jgi:hypothetical protein
VLKVLKLENELDGLDDAKIVDERMEHTMAPGREEKMKI